jgi:competence protein ComEA
MKTLKTLALTTLLALSPLAMAENAENVNSAENTSAPATTETAVTTQNPAQAVQNEEKTAKPNNTASNPNLVNINTASAAELQDKLVSIGAKKAQAIVEYREKNGAFKAVEQLTEVSGIGQAILKQNQGRIVLE